MTGLENKKNHGLAVVLLSTAAIYIIIWSYTGQWPWADNPYNSYVLQVKAWLSGSLDLGRDYSHLEIACYSGKYYVSFPPFPSVVLLPFVILGIPDGFAAFWISLASAADLFKLFRHCQVDNPEFWTLFSAIASNVLMVSTNSWVWFIAQNLSFLLTIMSIYYAVLKKGAASLACWAFAIGCRPFQIIYLPLLLMLLLERERIDIKKIAGWFIIPGVTALAYMAYNYARFDSVFEFGHNYLPEFLQSEDGQFNLSYIPGNILSLIRLPEAGEGGKLIYPKFNGMSVFLCFPIIIMSLIYAFEDIKNKKIITALLLVALHILLLTAHKTMGGYHFGNRYFIDVLPFFICMIVFAVQKVKYNLKVLHIPLFFFGIGINLTGVIESLVNF